MAVFCTAGGVRSPDHPASLARADGRAARSKPTPSLVSVTFRSDVPRAPGRNRQRQGRRTGLDDLGRRTLRLDAASKFAALDHGFASRRIGSVSAALPGQVDARLHVDGLELRGWTRYQSIRFTDRTLTAVVQSACNKPVSTLITHDHVRSGHGAWMAGPCRIPKLTVRVRFPSPAPNTKSVATHGDSLTPFSVLRRLGTSKNGVNDPRTICGPHTGHRLQCQHRSSGSQFPVSVRRWREWANNR